MNEQMLNEQKTALVLGATGGVGGAMARALSARGWRVRALNRDPSRIAKPIKGVEWVKGDAMDAADVAAAAKGADLIVHGVNPPGYRNWAALALPMLASTIAAARRPAPGSSSPARSIISGPRPFPWWPRTRRNGPRRARAGSGWRWRRLRAAAEGGVPVLILRAGDYFGADSANSWFGGAVVTPHRRLKRVVYPGSVGHAWAYLPDVAETAMRLIERRAELPAFAVFHFDGHWFEHGVGMAEAVREAAGDPRLPIRGLPWPLIRLLSPFVETFREMLEMTYLWRLPLRLDNRRLVAFLGEEPHTPTVAAVRTSLAGLGCL